jgi:hypothetical protein
MISGVDPFERVVGWTNEKLNQLIFDSINLLQGLDKKAFCSFICSVNTSARSRLVEAGVIIPKPETICAQWCVRKASDWYLREHPDKIEPMTIFYDRGEKFFGSIKDTWLKERTPPNRVARKLFWDLVKNVVDDDMAYSPGIQAADMLAWSRSRGLSETVRDQRDLLKILRNVIPNWNLILDEDDLREAHSPKV